MELAARPEPVLSAFQPLNAPHEGAVRHDRGAERHGVGFASVRPKSMKPAPSGVSVPVTVTKSLVTLPSALVDQSQAKVEPPARVRFCTVRAGAGGRAVGARVEGPAHRDHAVGEGARAGEVADVARSPRASKTAFVATNRSLVAPRRALSKPAGRGDGAA